MAETFPRTRARPESSPTTIDVFSFCSPSSWSLHLHNRLDGMAMFRVIAGLIELVELVHFDQPVERESPLLPKGYKPWNEGIGGGFTLANSVQHFAADHEIH